MITQEQLKEVLHYCPETGVFTWLTSSKGRRKGSEAGTVYRKANGKSYRRLCLRYVNYAVHRLAVLYVTGAFPENEVDHEDGNGLNNRWNNLREVTRAQNVKNKRLQQNNTSGVMGVSWHTRDRRWLSAISVDGNRKFLGSFRNKEDAITARKAAEVLYKFHENHGTERPL
jgi:hypothetical protein